MTFLGDVCGGFSDRILMLVLEIGLDRRIKD
jgi:hypothetical protein